MDWAAWWTVWTGGHGLVDWTGGHGLVNWTGRLDWTGVLYGLVDMDWWTGLVDWTGGWWTGGLHGLVDWTGGLTLKFVSQQLVKAHLPVELCGNPARSLLSACIVLKQTSYYYNSEDLYT